MEGSNSMGPPISRKVHDAGREVVATTGSTIPAVLNQVLNRFLCWPLRAGTGSASDCESRSTETFGTIIFTAPSADSVEGPIEVSADALGCVIDVFQDMDLEQFHAAYERIACAKRLHKTPAPRVSGVPHTTVTLGVICANQTVVPLETLAEELDKLNGNTPSVQWPDMVVVLSQGIINYAVQFPGENISGDFLPPAEGATEAFTPPMYIITVMRPTGTYTFNKMCAFIIGHLAIFSPGAKLPNWAEILEGTPKDAVTLSGYQYNLSGELVPVPRQFYNDRYIAPRPLRIEDRQGNLLSTLQFLPWQSGGVVLLRGKLPLEGLLVFLGKEVLKKGGVIKRPDAQISYVLPITQTNFTEMVKRIQRQSNMVVRSDPGEWVVQKVADEGSRSPFVARLFMGILRLRDAVFPDPAERDKFDKSYEVVTSSLLNARTAAEQIAETWESHVRKVSLGEVARLQGKTIHIDKSIDQELRKQVESFLNAAVRVLKQGMQNLAKDLQVDIGFLFKKQAAFNRGIATLESTDPPLAEYLRQTRTWSECLLERRNAIEHEGWILSRVTYSDTGSGINANEPFVSGQPVSELVSFVFDRLACFVEEFTAHCLQEQMPTGITITEIAPADRVTEAPERFRVTLVNGGMPAWSIVFHRSSFEET